MSWKTLVVKFQVFSQPRQFLHQLLKARCCQFFSEEVVLDVQILCDVRSVGCRRLYLPVLNVFGGVLFYSVFYSVFDFEFGFRRLFGRLLGELLGGLLGELLGGLLGFLFFDFWYLLLDRLLSNDVLLINGRK